MSPWGFGHEKVPRLKEETESRDLLFLLGDAELHASAKLVESHTETQGCADADVVVAEVPRLKQRY